MKEVFCDSSSLISLTDACIIDTLYFLHDNYGVRFMAPPSIKMESVSNPLSKEIREYYASARRIEKLIDDKILELTEPEEEETKKLLDIANNLFFVGWHPLELIHYGETEMIAAAKAHKKNIILVDERTTRMLIESPMLLKEHMEMEFKTNVMIERNNMIKFSNYTKGIESIRSSEIAILAYEHGYFDKYGQKKKRMIEAVLYELKYSGCAIHMSEIEDYTKSILKT